MFGLLRLPILMMIAFIVGVFLNAPISAKFAPRLDNGRTGYV